jgi:hypothetical protein
MFVGAVFNAELLHLLETLETPEKARAMGQRTLTRMNASFILDSGDNRLYYRRDKLAIVSQSVGNIGSLATLSIFIVRDLFISASFMVCLDVQIKRTVTQCFVKHDAVASRSGVSLYCTIVGLVKLA